MFWEEFDAMGNASRAKAALLRQNGAGYFLASMLAGGYVGFGILLIFTAGGSLGGAPWAKIVMGISFGIALSLVVMAGAELFTGNNMVMTAGIVQKKVTFAETILLWIVCLIGNWLGSVVLAVVFWASGLASGATSDLMASTSAAKMAVPLWPLFFRGVLCNTLVCLAVWCSFRCKSDSGKLIMIFWCLYCFITCGFEHSIANMTLLTVGLLSPGGAAVSLSGYFYNILVVTFGNMAGAIIFLALPYAIISKKKEG
jgi:Formate/nitrite family of transporters